MPSKYSLTVELSAQILRELSSSPGRYPAFLKTAANNYKYGFQDQILIFAQKPEATACAEIEVWNKLGRWVNKGTKGIALLVDRDVPYRLRHVFDVSDTNSRSGRDLKPWMMEDRFSDQVIEALENSFGETEYKRPFERALTNIAAAVVSDNYSDYLEQLSDVCEGSDLEDLDTDNLRKEFRELLVNSVVFEVLTRCGYDASLYCDVREFDTVSDFNTSETMSVLGTAASDISEMVLREVEATVRTAAREEDKNRTFAEEEKTEDNRGEKNTAERSTEYGTDIQTGGGLPASESRSAGESEDREIRDAPPSVSARTQEGDPDRSSDDGQIERPPRTDRPGGDGDGGTPDGGDGVETGSERADEKDRSDEVGRDDELPASVGGGNGTERTRLQISGHDFNSRSDLPYYYAPDEKNELLRNCLALKNHRKEIAAFFEAHTDRKERGDFIRSFFDNIYVEHILDNGERVGYRAYDDLLTIWHGSYLSRDKEDFIPWWRVGAFVEGQILLDTWLSPDEKDLVSEEGQLRILDAQAEQKKSEFALPLAAIDFVLTRGSGVSQGKMRIFEQFEKQETTEKNVAFLKSEYGTGGYSDPIPESGYWEQHDGKGIELKKGDFNVLIPWNKVAKRIGELIAADRYLNEFEKAAYPAYQEEKENRLIRGSIAERFNSLVEDFNDYEEQTGGDIAVDRYAAHNISALFTQGERVIRGYGNYPDEYVLPSMRGILERIKSENTHLTERADELLEELDGTEIARPFELTEAEKNPPPQPKKEYRFSLGDKVFIGAKEYEVLDLGDPVVLFDPQYPLLTEEMAKDVFLTRVKENPLNDNHLVIADEPDAPDETDVEAERAINEHEAEFGADGTRVFREVQNTSGYELGFGHLGNGITVWNRLETENGDYKTVAHIAADRTVTIYDENMPEEVRVRIYDFAEKEDPTVSATQSGKVFETRSDDEKLPVYDRSTEILYAVLRALKMDDVGLTFEGEEIIAFDDDNRWKGKEFFRFLIDECFVFEDDGVVVGINDKLLSDFTELSEHYGVPVIDNRLYNVWREYLTAKFENPGAVVLYRIGDFYEVMGDDAEKIADRLSLHLGSRSVMFGRQVPMCGFPSFSLDENVQKLQSEGVVVVICEDGKTERISDDKRNESQETELLAPPPREKRRDLTPHVLYPEIKSDYRTNFKIEDDDIGVGTPLERFHHNIMAIQLLHKLEGEHRLADTNEQRILSDYVGWGGLSEFFEETNPHYNELRAVLNDEELASARESTLTAFYTPPVVIRGIYQALENMGFRNGNILEPSCGIGNFMGLIPDGMSGSRMYGVELDSVSGRIAQQLYQRNNIAAQGFESTDLPDSFFDAAVGNVPFGQFKVPDKKYDRYNFSIHDYFFARTLDKVRPGGVVAFITSRFTMDKENPSVRKYIAQRADLLGAIRLPNDTFKSAAGADVTADILFLQKRDRLIDVEPDWVHLGTDGNGITMNQYFIDNPDMIVGEMKTISGPFGPEPTCAPYEDQTLAEGLSEAVQNIHAEFTEVEFDDVIDGEEDNSIPADPSVRNFSYTVIDGKVYYRINSRMNPVDVSVTAENRIKGMIKLRDCTRQLIEYQMEDWPDDVISAKQKELNEIYDAFSKKYGIINSRANSSAFNQDSAYYLLTSLENLDDEGNFVGKADMFTKRTIRQKVIVTSVDTVSEALALSLAEKTKVNMPHMCELTGKTEEEIAGELRGVIFLNPMNRGDDDEERPKYLPADEYLSGNIREKLEWAKRSAELYPDDYNVNVQALEKVMPKDLSASEISVRLGATWIPKEDIDSFMWELFDTAYWMRRNISSRFVPYTGEWSIEGKTYDRGNIKVHSTYGTERRNGYQILEDTLNLRDVRVFDYVEDESGRKIAVLNKKETAIAQGKQQLIKEAFSEWIWKDPDRRERLTKLYNEKFNSTRPREYDGSHLNFVGMNPEITLRPHQVNAIAHILYGGNTLLAHVVGAGKTYEMVAAAQESKRLGLCHKSLFVVPNHLTEQWASEYLQLYPSANILVATKKDFETKNRKKFCGRIATGDYDAIIIGHSQFERIPMSVERQIAMLEQQEREIIQGIEELKYNRGERFSIKQMEKARKAVRQKLEKLNDQSRKDDVVTFEELGVDRLFIDEAHFYKNLAAFTKMRNVGGISQTEAIKSSDLYMKCRYLDELTGGRGVVFATGTPISNSMVEMYTMQKYLQYETLKRNDLIHFDSWASTFGETVTAIELAPEGNGYRAKTRFAKFYNLPELMSMFKEVADVQTADMLDLPVPKANYHNIVLKPSEHQKKMVESLSERAEKVRNRMVNSSVDNMLCITNDGRKLALDQRLLNDMLPDSETGKVSACADNVFDIWQRTADQRSTQLVFCDLSTPKGDGSFNVYDDLKAKLIAKGIPSAEIAFVHSAETESKKKELFGKVRSGQIRILIGSTQKMGAGTNVQKKLIALHHLDCPWRPADLQQREGRIIRQGNDNPEVEIYTYVTENTFDSYLYQLVESKQKFIGQIMTSKSPVRSAEDVDEQALSYAEIKALCTGNPYIKEKMDLDIDVARLKLLKANHLSQHYALEDKILKDIPKKIASLEQRIAGFKVDISHAEAYTHPNEDGFSPMIIQGEIYTDKKAAGTEILAVCKKMTSPNPIPLGSYRGFDMELSFDPVGREYMITLKNELRHTTPLGTDIFGNIQRLDNLISSFPEKQKACENQLENERVQLENAKEELDKPFVHEEELKTKSARLAELNAMLDLNKNDNEIVDGERDEEETPEPNRDERNSR